MPEVKPPTHRRRLWSTGKDTEDLSVNERSAIATTCGSAGHTTRKHPALTRCTFYLLTTGAPGVARLASVVRRGQARLTDPTFREFVERTRQAVLDTRSHLPVRAHLGKTTELPLPFEAMITQGIAPNLVSYRLTVTPPTRSSTSTVRRSSYATILTQSARISPTRSAMLGQVVCSQSRNSSTKSHHGRIGARFFILSKCLGTDALQHSG